MQTTKHKTYTLTFDGYWRDANSNGVPDRAGIYVVYACRHNKAEGTVSLREVIYIGEANLVRTRIQTHEKRPRWKRRLRPREELAFSMAPYSHSDRVRVEAALINRHKPPVNDEHVHSFPYPPTTVSLSGKTALLDTHFTVS